MSHNNPIVKDLQLFFDRFHSSETPDKLGEFLAKITHYYSHTLSAPKNSRSRSSIRAWSSACIEGSRKRAARRKAAE